MLANSKPNFKVMKENFLKKSMEFGQAKLVSTKIGIKNLYTLSNSLNCF